MVPDVLEALRRLVPDQPISRVEHLGQGPEHASGPVVPQGVDRRGGYLAGRIRAAESRGPSAATGSSHIRTSAAVSRTSASGWSKTRISPAETPPRRTRRACLPAPAPAEGADRRRRPWPGRPPPSAPSEQGVRHHITSLRHQSRRRSGVVVSSIRRRTAPAASRLRRKGDRPRASPSAGRPTGSPRGSPARRTPRPAPLRALTPTGRVPGARGCTRSSVSRIRSCGMSRGTSP